MFKSIYTRKLTKKIAKIISTYKDKIVLGTSSIEDILYFNLNKVIVVHYNRIDYEEEVYYQLYEHSLPTYDDIPFDRTEIDIERIEDFKFNPFRIFYKCKYYLEFIFTPHFEYRLYIVDYSHVYYIFNIGRLLKKKFEIVYYIICDRYIDLDEAYETDMCEA